MLVFGAQIIQNLVAAHIGKAEVQNHHLIFINIGQFQSVFAAIGFIDMEPLIFQAGRQALRQQHIVLYQHNTHFQSSLTNFTRH